MYRRSILLAGCLALCLSLDSASAAAAAKKRPSPPPQVTDGQAEQALLGRLDAPLLFVKRHSYTGIHIYDTYYKWPPGGGGIYVLENPAAPRDQWKIRPVIDPTTPGTLGFGVYTHPELSWDAKRLLFCFKGEPHGSTSIYEIGIDGRGLRRITDPTPFCACHKGGGGGIHDIAPAYLPDGRIVFLSTRPSGLVPCANEGVSILHVMNADGTDIHPISVNFVNEFDPCVLPDGRLLFGRWEYVDKNALTIQSLWTMNPDGTQETALYANNMVFPEALLDARPVPGTPLIVATLSKHNSTPRGSIGLVDPRKGKNDPAALVNLEHPAEPTFDRGDSCEPWPVSEDAFLFSGRPAGQKRNRIEMIDRAGRRATVLQDAEICLHSPMLIKPRPVPAVLPDTVDRTARTGRFFLQDVYQGLPGVRRGEVKWLRVIEETSRVSPTPGGSQPYNQTFLISAALAFSAKNYLGVVPVEADGSAYFEVPSGRAVFFQALDADGRLVQSMRTFVKASPGTTRSCVGCHEYKYAASVPATKFPALLERTPQALRDESWGSGHVDYPSMIQPILDRHCVRCHGGREGIAAGMDLSGGWTEHFNISYENLANRCETQLVAYWIAGIDCMNGTALWSSQIFKPRAHGSGAAPLAKLLVTGHEGRIPELTRPERDLLLAWIDSNGLYHGTWDYSAHGCAIASWKAIEQSVRDEMKTAGCLRCHAGLENDWINLREPEMSRVLRAPMAKTPDGPGLGLCRDRKLEPGYRRVRLLWSGYAHAVQPPERFPREPFVRHKSEGEPLVTIASTVDPHYQALLAAIREGRQKALAAPRGDMPGAEVLPGESRAFLPPPLPKIALPLLARPERDGSVRLAWEQSARTIGLVAEIHRGPTPVFTPGDRTLLARTPRFEYVDKTAPPGIQHYAIIFVSGDQRSGPSFTAVAVPPPAPPPAPADLRAASASCSIRVTWQLAYDDLSLGYLVYRGQPGEKKFRLLTPEPIRETTYGDMAIEPDATYSYVVRAVNGRGVEGPPSPPATAKATLTREPVFRLAVDAPVRGLLVGSEALPGKLTAGARVDGDALAFREGGYVEFPHRGLFDLDQPLAVECRVRFDAPGTIPVVLSCGQWRHTGWFLQRIAGGWRWHVGGLDCDGGRVEPGRWIHVVATYDGQTLRLYQDGTRVGEQKGEINRRHWTGPLVIGQYTEQAGPAYQTLGRVADVKIYHRILSESEITKR